LTELLENPFKAFSPDLSSGWLSWKGRPAPDPCAPAGFLQLYRREGGGGFGALSCAAIEHVGSPNLFVPELQGFSADGAHSVFRADEALTANASGATRVEPVLRPIYQLYESSAAGLHLVSVLPDGEASEADSSAGTVGETNVNAAFNFNRRGSLLNAVSADGSRVFWSTAVSGPVGPLYLRLNAEQGQSKIEAGKCTQPARACTLAVSATVSPAPARFQAANPQGTRALFTIESGPLAGNLYEFDAEAEPPTSTLIAEKTIAASSILGASENLSRVYYASTDASAQAQSEGALKGKPNVYLHEAGATRFVATLSSGGGETSDVDNLFGTPISAIPIFRTARVSPADGSLAFMSNSSALSKAVAGYDNTDLAGGLPDFEVYLYDPAAGKLRCVSCNPSGARPSGRVFAKGGNGGAGSWAAAKVPRFQTQLYQPRYLSDDGARLFFDSFEALVLGDTNGKQDVYQWEAAGAGGCGAEAPSYVPTSEGCLSLISSGQSPSDSEFLDASASGSDVFFTTVEGLLPQDYGLIDVYDARVGGGFPPPPNPVPACEGEACQGPLTPPDDPTPASAGFRGAGNVKAEPRRRCAKGKARRKGRCVARHKRPSKSKRGANRDRRTER
jgi:hypothetical protein